MLGAAAMRDESRGRGMDRINMRRERILHEMLAAARMRRRHRRMARAAVASLVFIAGAAAIVITLTQGAPDARPELAITRPATPMPAQVQEHAVGVIERSISDEELVRLLAEGGVEAGLIRIGHEVKVVPWSLEPPEDADTSEPAGWIPRSGSHPAEARAAS